MKRPYNTFCCPLDWNVTLSLFSTWQVTAGYISMSVRWELDISLQIINVFVCMWPIQINTCVVEVSFKEIKKKT